MKMKKIASLVAVGAMMSTQGLVALADEAVETPTTPVTVAVEQVDPATQTIAPVALEEAPTTDETTTQVDETKSDVENKDLPSIPRTEPIVDFGETPTDDNTSGDTSTDVPTPPVDGGSAIGNPNSTVDPAPSDGGGISVTPNDGSTTTTEPIQGGAIDPIKPEPKPIPEPVIPSGYSIHSKNNQSTVSEPVKAEETPTGNQEVAKKRVKGYPYDELPKTGDSMTVSMLGVATGLIGLFGTVLIKLKEAMG